jgi:hypothetical protein
MYLDSRISQSFFNTIRANPPGRTADPGHIQPPPDAEKQATILKVRPGSFQIEVDAKNSKCG